MFTISKPDGSLQSLADLRKFNKRIKRHPFPIPKIQEMLQKLESFMLTTSLDLNMGDYHILLTSNVSRLSTFVLPWGKYEISLSIFQKRMSEFMMGLELASAYLVDVL